MLEADSVLIAVLVAVLGWASAVLLCTPFLSLLRHSIHQKVASLSLLYCLASGCAFYFLYLLISCVADRWEARDDGDGALVLWSDLAWAGLGLVITCIIIAITRRHSAPYYSLSQASRSGVWGSQLVIGLLSVLWLLNAYNLLLSMLGVLPLTAASQPPAPFSSCSFLGLSSLLLLPASLTLTVFRYDEEDDAMELSFTPLISVLAGGVLSLLALLLFAYHRQLLPSLLLSHLAPPAVSVLLLLFSSVSLGFHRWRHGSLWAAHYHSMEDWDGSSGAVQAEGYGMNGTSRGVAAAAGGGKGRLSREYEALLRGADDFTVEDDEDGVSIF